MVHALLTGCWLRLCLWLQLLSCCWCSLEQHKQGIRTGLQHQQPQSGTSLEQEGEQGSVWGTAPALVSFQGCSLLRGLLCTSPDPPVSNCMLLEVGGGAGIQPGLVFYIGNKFAGNWRCWLVVLIQARPTGSCRYW